MKKKLIVTGGGGFIGKALCTALAKQGHQIISISRKHYPELVQMGVEIVQSDLSQDCKRLVSTFESADAVFHTAAKVTHWGKYREFYLNNVVATENVVNLCHLANVNKLIFTSSSGIFCDGSHKRDIDETHPYPKQSDYFYPKTKSLSEQVALAANSEHLSTLSLRFPFVWGKGDTHVIPSVIKKAKMGFICRVGRGMNVVDVSYIEDCVQAHLKAYQALIENPIARGKPFFISQGDPVNFWNWIDQILSIYQLPPIRRHIPHSVAKGVAVGLEWISKCLPHQPEPHFNKFLASQSVKDHYFDISAAKKLLDYHPSFTVEEALIHLKQSLVT